MFEEVLPQSPESEMSLLGSMMLSADAIDEVLTVIPADRTRWFSNQENQTLFAALVEMRDRGTPIDLVMLRKELERREDLHNVGGIEYVVACAESVPTHVNAKHYAGVVRGYGVRRDIIAACGEIQQYANEASREHDEAVEFAEKRLLELSLQSITSDATSIGPLARQVCKALDGDDPMERTIETGFIHLDQTLTGLHGGELIILAARPSVGKSALALNLAMNIAMGGNAVLFFSLEMTKRELAIRALSSESHVQAWKLRKRNVEVDEKQRIEQARVNLVDTPLFIDATPAITLSYLRANARRYARRENLACVVVDYLQLMTPSKGRRDRSREREVAEISAGLKALAKEINCPVIALSQLNRDIEKQDRRPRLSDLRESGAIEQDADVVLFVHRPPNAPPSIIIAKQRNGPLDDVELIWDGATMTFSGARYTPDPQKVTEDALDREAAPWA